MHDLTRWDIFLGCLGALTPLMVLFLGLHLQNRNDKKRSDAQLNVFLQEYGFHDHTEWDGQLHVSGIRRPRK
jgi:hypothetical protein